MNGFATYSMIVRSSLIPSFERYLDGVTSFDTYIHTYIHTDIHISANQLTKHEHTHTYTYTSDTIQ